MSTNTEHTEHTEHTVELAVVVDGVVTYKNNITSSINTLFDRLDKMEFEPEKLQRGATGMAALAEVVYADDASINTINEFTLGNRVLGGVYENFDEKIKSLQLDSAVDAPKEKFLFIMDCYHVNRTTSEIHESGDLQGALIELSENHISISCDESNNIELLIKDAARDNFSLVVVNEKLEIVFQAD